MKISAPPTSTGAKNAVMRRIMNALTGVDEVDLTSVREDHKLHYKE